MSKTILVVGAHTDDEHGMSGLICRLANDGHHVYCLITTDGINNSYERKAEMSLSGNILGIKDLLYLGEPDGKLTVTGITIANFNELVKQMPWPDVVFVMSANDYHPDHRRTADLVLSSVLSDRGTNTPLFAYELNSSGRAHKFIRVQTFGFYPTHYCDVTSVYRQIKLADSFHKSQDPPEMWKGVEANLISRGRECTELLRKKNMLNWLRKPVRYAQAFQYLTRLGPVPPWLDKYLFSFPIDRKPIPFPVTEESIFFTKK